MASLYLWGADNNTVICGWLWVIIPLVNIPLMARWEKKMWEKDND
jgi:hypothetical protein